MPALLRSVRVSMAALDGIACMRDDPVVACRFEFLNTFFSVSEACIYMQLVQRLDSGELGDLSPQFSSYQGLAALVGK